MNHTDTSSKKIKFVSPKRDLFLATVRERVDQYFKEKNISRHATTGTLIKVGIHFILGIALYFSIILQLFSAPILLVLSGFLGIVSGFIGVNLCHDCMHGSFSSNVKVNRALSYIYDFVGLSSFVWKITHNGGHHTYTNIHGHDPDIDKPFILKLSPGSQWYPFHRFQHFYIWLLYSLVGINWVFFADYLWVAKEWKKISWTEFALFLTFKIINFIIFLGIPLYVMTLPTWQILLGYLSYQVFGGFAVALVFQLAHLVENVDFPVPDDDGVLNNQWGAHEMHTTSNFGTNNSALNVLVGGLNFQIEHHLMPYVSHSHYKDISPIVRQTAKEFNLPYHECPTLLEAVKSHYRVIRRLGERKA